MAARFSIAHVTPYPWEASHEVNTYVRCVAAELSRRGHRVVILAPSRSPARVRETRRTLRAARERPEDLLDATSDAGAGVGRPRVLAVGEVLDVAGASRRSAASSRRRPGALSVDAPRTLDELFSTLRLDFVHVHEPFAPSLSSAALRNSRALNVGSFHAPSELLLSTQVARRFVEAFFGRLDARTASSAVTARLLESRFPGEYRVVPPGWDAYRYARAFPDGAEEELEARRPNHAVGFSTAPRTEALGERGQPVRLLFVAYEERSALRLFMRALRRLHRERPGHLQVPWEATVVGDHEEGGPGEAWGTLRESLGQRVRLCSFGQCQRTELLARADVVVCASDGTAPAPMLVLQALALGAVGVASRLPIYEEVLGDGERGLLFEPGDADTLAAQLHRLIADGPLRERLCKLGESFARRRTWERSARELEALYGAVASRRHHRRSSAAVHRALARAPVIDADLHMHTDHSPDCATPVEVLLATARERGLGAIAVTDHNEISGALAAQAQATAAGIKVIVGEEVKTAGQGEVIGLFLERKIQRGLTLAETVAEIKRQGGLVYVPHPFDRLHAVPDYEHLLPILAEVDAIEVFNPRVAIDTFNEEAVRFAAKYNIAAGAGSDSHVPQGLGSVRLRMHDFDSSEQFLQSLRDADIVTRPSSLLYVQALKFLQTKATPAPARRARSARRVRRLSTQR
jgi:predicted metal-dependent phosphoesterase TrpH/glycosyltransferase involved in cell wall biosynthesis